MKNSEIPRCRPEVTPGWVVQPVIICSWDPGSAHDDIVDVLGHPFRADV